MLHRLNLSNHKHTGKIIDHNNTSYWPLMILLVITGVVLSMYTAFPIYAQHPGPEAGSIGLIGVVPGEPPDAAPVITSPKNGQRFSKTPVNISGTCVKDTLVEIYKNDIFAGSVFCDVSGKFSLQIDLMYGKNLLKAVSYDALNQSSPESEPVTVYYDASASQPNDKVGLDFGTAQLLLITDAVYRGVFPNKEMTMPIQILGGRSPYAIGIKWGDGKDDLISRNDNSTFKTTHTYEKAGTFQISIQGTDAEGRVAFITIAAVVNGQPERLVSATGVECTSPQTNIAQVIFNDTAAAADCSGSSSGMNVLLALWPVYIAIIAIVTSFWLGERHEKHVLEKRGLLADEAGYEVNDKGQAPPTPAKPAK